MSGEHDVFSFPLSDLATGGPNLFGGILGEQHRERLVRSLGPPTGQVVLFDLKGVQHTTASYLKATVIWLLRAASAAFDSPPAPDTAAVDIYPAVAHVSDDVVEELDAVLRLHQFVCLNAMDWNATRITRARVLGHLDTHLDATLRLLCQHGEATASMLLQAAPEDRINLTGWNNRLNDLGRLRLARRRKEGRHWMYQPIPRKVV